MNLIERTEFKTTNEKNPTLAKKFMVDQAMEQAVETIIIEMIGDEKYLKNRPLIKNKIITHSSRFIPYSKTVDFTALENSSGYSMKVLLKINTDDLQKLLLDLGLYYETEKNPLIIPFIQWIDYVHNHSFSWWNSSNQVENNTFLMKKNREFEVLLKSLFQKSYFLVATPSIWNYQSFLDSTELNLPVSQEFFQKISQKFNGKILIIGGITTSKNPSRPDSYNLTFKLKAIQSSNFRVIADVTREFSTNSGPFEVMIDKKIQAWMESLISDLVTQVVDVWQKGALGAHIYLLTLKGTRINPITIESIKEQLHSQIRDIKTIREHILTHQSCTFEVETSLPLKTLEQKIGPRIESNGNFWLLQTQQDPSTIPLPGLIYVESGGK